MVGRGKLHNLSLNRSYGGGGSASQNGIYECEPKMLSDGIVQRRVYSPSKVVGSRSPPPPLKQAAYSKAPPRSNTTSQHGVSHYECYDRPSRQRSVSHRPAMSPLPTHVSPGQAPACYSFVSSAPASQRSGAQGRSRSLEMVSAEEVDLHYYDHLKGVISPTPLNFFEVPTTPPKSPVSFSPVSSVPTPHPSEYSNLRNAALSEDEEAVSMVLPTDGDEDEKGTPEHRQADCKEGNLEEEERTSPIEEIQGSLRRASESFQKMLLEVESQRSSHNEVRNSLNLLAASRPTSVLITPLSESSPNMKANIASHVDMTPVVGGTQAAPATGATATLMGTVSRNLNSTFRGDSPDDGSPRMGGGRTNNFFPVPATPAQQCIAAVHLEEECGSIRRSTTRVAGLLAIARQSLFKDPHLRDAIHPAPHTPTTTTSIKQEPSPEEFIDQAEREYQSTRTSGGSNNTADKSPCEPNGNTISISPKEAKAAPLAEASAELDDDSFFERTAQLQQQRELEAAPRVTATPKEMRAEAFETTPTTDRPSFELPGPRVTVSPKEAKAVPLAEASAELDDDSFFERTMQLQHQRFQGTQGKLELPNQESTRRTASPSDLGSISPEPSFVVFQPPSTSTFSPPPPIPNAARGGCHGTTVRVVSTSPQPTQQSGAAAALRGNFMLPTASSQARASKSPVPSRQSKSPVPSSARQISKTGMARGAKRDRSPQTDVVPSRVVVSSRSVSPRHPVSKFERPGLPRPKLRPTVRSVSPFATTTGVLHGQGMGGSRARSLSPSQYLSRCQMRLKGAVPSDAHCADRLAAFVELYQKARLEIKQSLVKHEVSRSLNSSSVGGGEEGGAGNGTENGGTEGMLPFNLVVRTLQRCMGGAVPLQLATRSHLAVTEKLSLLVEDMHCLLVLKHHQNAVSKSLSHDKENSGSPVQHRRSSFVDSDVHLNKVFPPALFNFTTEGSCAAKGHFFSDRGVTAVEEAKELVSFRDLLALLDELPSHVKDLVK